MTARPGYATVNAYLVCDPASNAIAWYVKHLGAIERYRLAMPDGKIAHAEVEIGDTVIMIADAFPEMGINAPDKASGSPVGLTVYVDDVDLTFAAMLADGAKELFEVKDQFHGDRSGKLADPFGHVWYVSTNQKALSADEIVASFKAMMGG